MSGLIISASGARGIVGQSLTPDIVVRLAVAFGNFIDGRRIIVGYDSRTSSPMFLHAVCAGLIGTGCTILDVGMCPTPTVLLMSKQQKADGSIMITASHNPAEWNGLEFAKRSGRLLNNQDRKKFLDIYHNQEMKLCSWQKQGQIEKLNHAVNYHIEKILTSQWVNLEQTHARQLKVVIDAGNGAGSQISPVLLKKLGCQVFEVFCQPNGLFPRPSEPHPEALSQLCQTVQAEEADIGLAHDGDADRLVIVDQFGCAISSEYTFALIADFLLQKTSQPAYLVGTVSTSRLIDEVATRYKANLFRVPVGVSFVVEKMQQLLEEDPKALVLGGEGTGGVILPDWQYTTDGIAAIAIIVQMLADQNFSIQSCIGKFPQYAMHKIQLEIESHILADELLQRTTIDCNGFSNFVLDLTDGIKFIWPDRWVNIRKSGTEPIMRIFSEAPSKNEAKQLAQKTYQQLQKMLMELKME